MKLDKITAIIILLLIIILISGCANYFEQNECDKLTKEFDKQAKIVNGNIGLEECTTYDPDTGIVDTVKGITVGATLLDIKSRYINAYYHTLTLKGDKKQGTISIKSSQPTIPYQIGKFYKFDLGRVCSNYFSAGSGGRFLDPSLNALQAIECDNKIN